MGIRDFTYYDRTLLLRSSPTDHFSGSTNSFIEKIICDISSNFYTLERFGNPFIAGSPAGGLAVRKSADAGLTWTTVKVYANSGSSVSMPFGLVSDSSGSLFLAYATGTYGIVVEKSVNAGLSWSICFSNPRLKVFMQEFADLPDRNNPFCFEVGIHPGNQDHILGFANARKDSGGSAANSLNYLFYSRDNGTTWQSQSFGPVSGSGIFLKPDQNKNGFYFANAQRASNVATVYNNTLRSASYDTGTTSYLTSTNLSTILLTSSYPGYWSMDIDSAGKYYVLQTSASFSQPFTVGVLTSSNGLNFFSQTLSSETIQQISAFNNGVQKYQVFKNPTNNDLFFNHFFTGIPSSSNIVDSVNPSLQLATFSRNENVTFFKSPLSGGLLKAPQFFMIKNFGAISEVYLMSLNANSSSIGPISLGSTITYASNLPGNPTTKYKLNNVSEYSHAGGIFQMKNIVLGTRDSGKIGNTDDSIIQINHIGSVVKVMWPKQDSITQRIKGFGDFSAGERPGKLTNAFQPGEEFDVTPYDHVCLYGYLSKEVSGTLDDVVVQVERKPLNDAAFAVEQTISYSLSGSKTEARLTDIEYKKQIDYGDLSVSKVGFPIDIPLTNTKLMRVSVRHRLGQSHDLNKNFILWGRFIKSSKDTNET